jgi:predicted RNA-binding Zn-ribbon protein involved in translation (DUF1610 family)
MTARFERKLTRRRMLMPLKPSDALIQELFAPHLTSDDGEVSCVYGLHEPHDDWIMYWFFGPLLRFFLLKHLLIAVTERRLLLMEISGFYQEKNCQSIEFDEVEQVQVDERSAWGFPFSIVRLKVQNGNRYRVTIRPEHPGMTKHEEHYRKVIAFCKSLAGETNGGVGPATHLARRPCPQCGERVNLEAKVCRFCNYRFNDQEIALVRSQSQARASFMAENAHREQLQRSRRRRSIAGWILIVIGGLLLFFMVLGTIVPAPEGQPEKKFDVGPFLGGLACFLIVFIAPGLFLLTRAWKLKHELALLPAITSPSPRGFGSDSVEEHRQIQAAQATATTASEDLVTLICSGCGKKLKLKVSHKGKKVKCPHCQGVTQVPS